MIMRVFLYPGEGRAGRQSQASSCPLMPLPILILADFGDVPLSCISRSFLHRLTHPSLCSADTFRCKVTPSANYIPTLFPKQVFLRSSSSPPSLRVSKETFQVDFRATCRSSGEPGEIARQQFSLAGSAMLYAVIYEAQEEPAALKYISFSFPTSPALLKPTFICKYHGRHQGHELDECSGRKTAFRKEERRARESKKGSPGWGRAARETEQRKQQQR